MRVLTSLPGAQSPQSLPSRLEREGRTPHDAAFAEWKREMIRERILAGVGAARANAWDVRTESLIDRK